MRNAPTWISLSVGILSLITAALAVGARSEKISTLEGHVERLERRGEIKLSEFELLKTEVALMKAAVYEIRGRSERIEKIQDMTDDKVDELLRRSRK